MNNDFHAYNFPANLDIREGYLQYRAAWKANYKQLSQQIRDTRKAFVEAQRAYSAHERTNPEYWGQTSCTLRANVDNLRYELHNLRGFATQQLHELASEKEIAAMAYVKPEMACA